LRVSGLRPTTGGSIRDADGGRRLSENRI